MNGWFSGDTWRANKHWQSGGDEWEKLNIGFHSVSGTAGGIKGVYAQLPEGVIGGYNFCAPCSFRMRYTPGNNTFYEVANNETQESVYSFCPANLIKLGTGSISTYRSYTTYEVTGDNVEYDANSKLIKWTRPNFKDASATMQISELIQNKVYVKYTLSVDIKGEAVSFKTKDYAYNLDNFPYTKTIVQKGKTAIIGVSGNVINTGIIYFFRKNGQTGDVVSRIAELEYKGVLLHA